MTVVAETRVTDTDELLPVESWASTPAPHDDVMSTEEWLDSLPTEALQCRVSGHHWERNVLYDVTGEIETRRGKKITELTRELNCLGGCGTVKREVLVPRGNGHLESEQPRYVRTKPYERVRDGSVRLDPIDRSFVRGLLVRRLLPDLEFWGE